MRYPLAKDTAHVLETNAQHNRNLGLALDRYLALNDETDTKGDLRAESDIWKIREEAKRRQLAPLSQGAPIPTLLKHANARRKAMLDSMASEGFCVRRRPYSPDYRLIVGFGTEHVLETSICLHRIYGFPIVPGSAVKGVTRAWAHWEISEALAIPEATRSQLASLLSEGEEMRQKALWSRIKPGASFAEWQNGAHSFYAIFGTTSEKGSVIFLDAYPTSVPKIKLDVLNPHYGKYYQGSKPPGNYLNPVPSYFLSLDRGSEFEFAIAGADVGQVDQANRWFRNALTELGIGAKTSAGYGFMKNLGV